MKLREVDSRLQTNATYNIVLAIMLNSIPASILLTRLLYWSGKEHNPDGWIYKTEGQLFHETGMKRRPQETARKKLRELGLIEECHKGIPRKNHFRVNLALLRAKINVFLLDEEALLVGARGRAKLAGPVCTSGLDESAHHKGHSQTDSMAQKGPTNTKETQKDKQKVIQAPFFPEGANAEEESKPMTLQELYLLDEKFN